MAEGEAKIILEKLEAMAKIGVDFAEFRERLMVYFQHKLLSFYGVGEERESKLTQEETVRFLNLLILSYVLIYCSVFKASCSWLSSS